MEPSTETQNLHSEIDYLKFKLSRLESKNERMQQERDKFRSALWSLRTDFTALQKQSEKLESENAELKDAIHISLPRSQLASVSRFADAANEVSYPLGTSRPVVGQGSTPNLMSENHHDLVVPSRADSQIPEVEVGNEQLVRCFIAYYTSLSDSCVRRPLCLLPVDNATSWVPKQLPGLANPSPARTDPNLRVRFLANSNHSGFSTYPGEEPGFGDDTGNNQALYQSEGSAQLEYIDHPERNTPENSDEPRPEHNQPSIKLMDSGAVKSSDGPVEDIASTIHLGPVEKRESTVLNKHQFGVSESAGTLASRLKRSRGALESNKRRSMRIRTSLPQSSSGTDNILQRRRQIHSSVDHKNQSGTPVRRTRSRWNQLTGMRVPVVATPSSHYGKSNW